MLTTDTVLCIGVGDRVFLWVSPFQRMLRFGRWCKHSLQYIGPFKILRRLDDVAYELELPLVFLSIHLIFYVSMLWRYIPDESHLLQYGLVELDDSLIFVKEPISILARDVTQLSSRAIAVVKIQWRHRLVEKTT